MGLLYLICILILLALILLLQVLLLIIILLFLAIVVILVVVLDTPIRLLPGILKQLVGAFAVMNGLFHAHGPLILWCILLRYTYVLLIWIEGLLLGLSGAPRDVMVYFLLERLVIIEVVILNVVQRVRIHGLICAMLLPGTTGRLLAFELLILRDLVQLRLLFQILELLHDLLLVHFEVLALIVYQLILRRRELGMQGLESTHGLFARVHTLVLCKFYGLAQLLNFHLCDLGFPVVVLRAVGGYGRRLLRLIGVRIVVHVFGGRLVILSRTRQIVRGFRVVGSAFS